MRLCAVPSKGSAVRPLLAIAIAFHFTIHRRITLSEPPEPHPNARMVATLSLALWFGVALAGKAIAIFQPA